MHYYIDGYNFLFRLSKKSIPLEAKRREIIATLNRFFKSFQLKATIVFDSSDAAKDLPTISHFDFLEVIYTMKGQTADQYILEEVYGSDHPEKKVVISSDRELTGRCRQLGAKVLSIEEFLTSMIKKKKKVKKSTASEKEFKVSEHEIKRLLAIFEKKLRDTL